MPPCFMGFVEQLRDVEFTAPHRTHLATITLVARRSVRRIGTRQWRRGSDLEVSGRGWGSCGAVCGLVGCCFSVARCLHEQ